MPEKRLLYKYISYIRAGHNLRSKLRLAIIVASTNHIILGEVPDSIGKILTGVSNWLSHGITTNIHGLKLRVIDHESCYICTPLFEEWAWDYLTVQEGDLFIDIGAHLGRYTLPIAKAVGEKGLVIAVDASGKNYYCLKKNIESNNLHNIIAINVAAWSNDENLKFYPGESSGKGSIRKGSGQEHVEVNGRSLDSLLEELNREVPVNWIKIDVEGAELEVLKGLNKTLSKNSPKLLIEVFEKNAIEFERYMNTLDYSYYIIPESISVGLKYYYCRKNQDVHEVNGKRGN